MGDAGVQRAVDFVWDSDLNAADRELQTVLSEQENHIEANLRYSQVAWLRAMLSEDEDHAKEAYSRLQACDKICKNTSSNEFEIKTARAEVILLHSLLLLRLGSYLSGAYKLRKAWIQFRELSSDSQADKFNSSSKEIQQRILFVVAAFNFFVSIIPPTLLFLVSALGFEANRQGGYSQLQECFHSGTSISPLAGIIVLWIQSFFLENLDEALDTFTLCMEQYKNNLLVLYMGGYLHRQRFEVQKALVLFQKAQQSAVDFHQFKLSCTYEVGDCYWKLMDWEQSVKYLESFLIENKSKSFRCFAAYQLGVAYCFLGDEEKAGVWFLNSKQWARKYFSFDAFAARKSKEYLTSSPMIRDIEKTFIVATNLRKQGRQAEALEDLTRIEETLKDDVEALAFYYYFTGRLLKETGSLEKALVSFQQCVEQASSVKKEKYTIPHSLMESGDVSMRLGNREAAIEYLQQAKKYKSYDFDKPNIRRIMRLLDQAEDIDYVTDNMSFSANE